MKLRNRLIATVLALTSFGVTASFAQDNMGVGTSTPDPSAVLDLDATDKGLLVPRLTTSQRTLIFTPATGLLVFDTDVNQFWFFDGAQWVQAIGPMGNQGPQGPQGPAGLDGTQGLAGADGADGAQGPQGLAGVDGVQGPQGPAGVAGAAGADGAQGPAGTDGADGADGAQGLAGADGADGAQGPAGADGADGAQGPAGADGADGADGAQGSQGPAGADGADGAQGPAGADGVQGPQGPQGPQGAAGADGADGAQGLAGADGADGADGAQGPQGPQGVAGADGAIGPQGQQGPQGPQGVPGSQGPAGANGAQGPAGPQGPVGANGANGAQGPAGANGAQGPAGANGAQGPAGPVGCATPNYLVKSNGSTAVCSQVYDNGSSVGIGTTAPGYKLDLVGGQQRIRYDRYAQSGAGSNLMVEIPWPGPSLYLPSVGFHWPGQYLSQLSMFNNGGLAAIDNAGTNGVPFYASSFNNFSDINIKKDVVELNEADYVKCLNDIREIRNIKYRFQNEDADKASAESNGMIYRAQPHIGVEAQSLPAEVYTEVLNATSPDGSNEDAIDFKGYGLADMDGLLIGGIKALDAKIEKKDELIQNMLMEQQLLIEQLRAEIEALRNSSK